MCVPILIFLLISYLILTSYFNQIQDYLKLHNNFFLMRLLENTLHNVHKHYGYML